MLSYWIIVCAALTFFYFLQFSNAVFSWKNIKQPDRHGSAKQVSFSLIVAIRNEEQNILRLIDNLKSLNYPEHLFEVILVDDFSDDETLMLIEKMEGFPFNFKVVSLATRGLKHNRAFKKTAIQIGVSEAINEWIVTTDADCLLQQNHLLALNNFIVEHDPKFISGPVVYSTNSLMERVQAVEFMGLVTLGAAYLERQIPFLCNGANLAFPRHVFQSLNGYKGADQTESGDDIWFMHKVFRRYPHQMYFVKHPDLIVKTKPSENLKIFLNQRKRWTSKNSSYGKVNQTLILGLDYLFYLSIIMNVALGFSDPFLFQVLGFQLLVKALIEMLLFASANKFFRIKAWLLAYLVAFPFQILYVVLIYPLSQFTKFEWKNRKFNA